MIAALNSESGDAVSYAAQASLQGLFQLLSFSSNAATGETTGPAEQRRLAIDQRPLTIWGQYNQSFFDNDINGGAYDGDVWGYNLGVDYRYNDKLTAGLTIGCGSVLLARSRFADAYSVMPASQAVTPVSPPVIPAPHGRTGGYPLGCSIQHWKGCTALWMPH